MRLLAFSTHSLHAHDFPGTALRKENKNGADHYGAVPRYGVHLFTAWLEPASHAVKYAQNLQDLNIINQSRRLKVKRGGVTTDPDTTAGEKKWIKNKQTKKIRPREYFVANAQQFKEQRSFQGNILIFILEKS